ncbi:MAG: type I-B CRISPR-associated protein Cas7/Csh2 [Candidatus Nanoarchaeia archaeon]|nr:type I-B CRISPR-associated protein Cas7/Csh2 [Candidatus Nanoarchaeia archaeon]
MSTITKNSQLLFLYDAKMSNPNGDMDNENKPRMDYDTSTNLVSDVRIKRFIRDYFESNLKESIFVTSDAKNSKERGVQLQTENKTHKDLIDVRLFGAVFAESGANSHLTGPVQFDWSYSLNPVTLVDSSTITSSFSSGEGVGKDFRVNYSLLAASGTINAQAAKDTNMSVVDQKIFDEAVVKAMPLNPTRSKRLNPRLYLRIELNDDSHTLKDLREYLKISYEDKDKELDSFQVRFISQVKLDITALITYLESKKHLISKILWWKDDQIQITNWQDLATKFTGKMEEIKIDIEKQNN